MHGLQLGSIPRLVLLLRAGQRRCLSQATSQGALLHHLSFSTHAGVVVGLILFNESLHSASVLRCPLQQAAAIALICVSPSPAL